MSYKLKTLIVFDTNSLRSTEGGEVAYSFFAFGRPYQVIEEFITEKNLADDIHVAVPTWAIEELKDQKQRQYTEDIANLTKLAARLNGLPHIPALTIPDDSFNCKEYVEEKANEFIASKSIKLLEIKEEIANTVLRSMMVRVMKDENYKKPFAHSGKYKDAGFKDNIIWESLMNFNEVGYYDKIILLSKDGDYRNCEAEFRGKWNKHIKVLVNETYAISEIQTDYDNYIKERAIHDFAQTEYFKDYIKDDMAKKTAVVIDNNEFKIENFEITDICKLADRQPPNEEEVENIIVHSEIKIFYSVGGDKKEQLIEALTLLWDDETKEIQPPIEYSSEIK